MLRQKPAEPQPHGPPPLASVSVVICAATIGCLVFFMIFRRWPKADTSSLAAVLLQATPVDQFEPPDTMACSTVDFSTETGAAPAAGLENSATAPRPVPGDALTTELPPCAYRVGVTPEEIALIRFFLADPTLGWPAIAIHEGMLALGVAREVLLFQPKEPRKRAAELAALSNLFRKTLAWRVAAYVDTIMRDGLPSILVDGGCQPGGQHGGCQPRAHHYGSTRAGLPVIVDSASEWRRAIRNARELGLTPAVFATTRIYWHERCLQTARKAHEAGRGEQWPRLERASKGGAVFGSGLPSRSSAPQIVERVHARASTLSSASPSLPLSRPLALVLYLHRWSHNSCVARVSPLLLAAAPAAAPRRRSSPMQATAASSTSSILEM